MSFEGIKTARKLTCVASRKEIDALRYSPRGNAGVFNVDIIFYPIDFPSIPQFSGVFYGRKSKRIVFTRACHGPKAAVPVKTTKNQQLTFKKHISVCAYTF